MARDCDGIEQLRIFAEFGGELWLRLVSAFLLHFLIFKIKNDA